ncbi:uncharacterized protein LOC126609283 [Malus sylvestris]|uniref:uncharacterized protein LOC126609283 n=1 Tax=Malus sylvestris TaxID=3752 RepID=UPI0021ABBB3C|nr:uncharacterized protein LOC126609283 [Malus sylvestris]
MRVVIVEKKRQREGGGEGCQSELDLMWVEVVLMLELTLVVHPEAMKNRDCEETAGSSVETLRHQTFGAWSSFPQILKEHKRSKETTIQGEKITNTRKHSRNLE